MFKEDLARKHIACDPYQAMDYRHIQLLYSILADIQPKHACEVGSCYGASTVAFLSAWWDNHVNRVTCIDPEHHREVFELARMAVLPHGSDSLFTVVTGKSEDVLPGLDPFPDFLFLDGDHSVEQMVKESRIVQAYRPNVVCIHDSTAVIAGYNCCPGPQYMKQYLQTHGYLCIEDSIKRDGERTERGFLCAVRDGLPITYRLAVECFQSGCV